MYQVLSKNVIREICDFYPADLPLLVDLQRKYLRIFSYKQQNWGPKVQLSQEILSEIANLRWISTKNQEIIVCGGKLSLFLL